MINASDNGAHIPGIPDMTLRAVIKNLGPGGRVPDLASMVRAMGARDPGRVRQSLKLAWDLVGSLLMMMRLKVEAGSEALAEYRGSDPVLRMILAGLPQYPDPGEAMKRLEEAENLILKMLSDLD